MKDFAFATPTKPLVPRRRSSYAIAAVFYAVVIALLIGIKTHPQRVSSAGSPYGSMVAYVPGPVGGAPASTSKPVPAQPKKPAMTTKTARASDAEAAAAVGTAGTLGAGQGSGPVRLGTGGNLTLLKRVQPVYPPIMQSARVTGQVVLDAIIKPDGTIGDIKVLQATNEAFAQSAIAAVKQWQYTALGFEGILTVNVNFSM